VYRYPATIPALVLLDPAPIPGNKVFYELLAKLHKIGASALWTLHNGIITYYLTNVKG